MNASPRPEPAEIVRLWTARPAWVLDAACRGMDPNLFFPERGSLAEEAKYVCSECPVRAECAQQAAENHERFGVWGGRSPKQRREPLTVRRKPGPVKGAMLKPIRHGSSGGYEAHRRRGEEPCLECRAGKNQYQITYKLMRRGAA